MSTVAQNLQTLAAIKEDIRQAIVTKGQSCPVGTPFADYADKIEAISGGGDEYEEQPIKDVTFFDYDGRVPYSYTAQEFLALETLPTPPTHEGLTAQGWNWTLTDAKAEVQFSGQLDIGAHYVTSDGKTRLYIEVPDGGISLSSFSLNSNNRSKVVVDWGDGTEPLTEPNPLWNAHTYANGGKYVITIYTTESGIDIYLGYGAVYGLFGIYNQANQDNEAPHQMLYKAELGANVTKIFHTAFNYERRLETITIPKDVVGTDATNGFSTAWQQNINLRHITLPYNANPALVMFPTALAQCYTIKSVAIPKINKIPNYAFRSNLNVKHFNIPSTITEIGGYAFENCNKFGPKVIIPAGVTSIGIYAFSNCFSINEYYLLPTTPPTITNATFAGLRSWVKFYVPNGKLNDYQTAENWAVYASYMVEMDE